MSALESMFRLSLIMNMVDNLTGPMAGVQSSVQGSVSSLQSAGNAFGEMTTFGATMATVGEQITGAVLAPVEATFATRRAIGELSSLGVKDLEAIERAAENFSSTWAGTSKAEFITAAYDIKSGIASLTDEGVADYTRLAGLTASATKSTTATMTDLFATSYGIYKDYYDDMSDLEFGEMFSSGLATTVRLYKTSGDEMSAAISRLGASATNANVPLEEQLAVLGQLQTTMGGSEAATKYNAFLRNAARAGEELGLNFLDANNQLRSLPEIMAELENKFGDTLDAAEKIELQKAFGDQMSIQFIDLFYGKTEQLEQGILDLYDSMAGGLDVTYEMANAINDMEPAQFEVIQQQIQNTKEKIGTTLLPTINELFGKVGDVIARVGDWIDNNEELVRIIMIAALALGGFLTVGGTTIAVIGGVGLIFTKTAGFVKGFIGVIKGLPGMFDTIRLYGMFAGDAIKKGFSTIKSAGAGAISSIKNVAINIASMAKTAAVNAVQALKSMVTGLIGMAKQAITTAATALPGLIASVWSFTAALLANPITWIVIGIMALIAGIVLLWNKCEWFRNGVMAVINFIKEKFGAAVEFFKNLFSGIANFIGNTFGKIKDFIGDKLSSIKSTYEEHGGGIQGVAAVAMEGVKGIFSGAYSFLDNLTGGKLSAIKDTVTEKLGNMKAAYDEHGGGIKGVAAAAMEGVKSIYTGAYNFLDNLTGGKLSAIRDKFSEGVANMKNAITEKFTQFKEAGKKLITTFTDGIKSAFTGAVDAVKGGLSKIRNLLPFSDAKEGPLSTLTLSGTRLMTTIAEGVQRAEDAPADAAEAAFSKVDATGRQAVKKVELRETLTEDSPAAGTSGSGERQTIIEKLLVNVDLKTIKDLQALLALVKELEDAAISNGVSAEPQGA